MANKNETFEVKTETFSTIVSKASIKTLKAKVELILSHFPDTRNSDTKLGIKLRTVFYREHIVVHGGKKFMPLDHLFSVPTITAMTRIRASVQNKDKRFLPTSRDVAKKRGINEDVWRTAMGTNEKSTLFE